MSVRHCLLLPLVVPLIIVAQDFGKKSPGFEKHDGFYLSLNPGHTWGKIRRYHPDYYINTDMKYSGFGFTFDAKIGYAIVENVILSFDWITRNLLWADVEIEDEQRTHPDSYGIDAGDNTYGIGFTYYFMPHNFFANISIGIGSFSIVDQVLGDAKSDNGLSIHLKIGKEFWVYPNWAWGISGGFGILSASEKEIPDVPFFRGTIMTKKFFLMINTTYN